MLRVPFLLLLAMVLPACAPNEALVDLAFCDQDEPCFDVGSGGSGGGVTTGGAGGDPGAFTCGGVVCAEAIPMGACVTEWTCNKNGKCAGTEAGASGFNDFDECTIDSCEGGEWKHRPMTEAEISDGDPCTNDTCAPDVGPIHVGNCG